MNEYPGLVDSHCHLLSLSEKGLDPRVCLQEFFDAGGRWLLDVAVDTEAWNQRLEWDDPRVFRTAGIHPSEAPLVTSDHWQRLEVQLNHPRCRAVGEMGLDWYRGRDHEGAQREVFRRQLDLGTARDLPVVIHNRDADAEILEDLDAVGWRGRGVLHCFSSNLDFARRVLDRGFFLSFAGNLTYKSAQTLRDVAAWAPLDRLLVETDSPYLAPQAFRGQVNRPVHAGRTAQCLADVRGLPLEAVLEATAENFARLFRVGSGVTGRG